MKGNQGKLEANSCRWSCWIAGFGPPPAPTLQRQVRSFDSSVPLSGCNLTDLACDTDFQVPTGFEAFGAQVRVDVVCSDGRASVAGVAKAFRTAAGAGCQRRAGAPAGLLLTSSVSSLSLTWEAAAPNAWKPSRMLYI